MDFITQALASNGIGIVILIVLYLNFHKKFSYNKKEHIVFLLMVAINILQCIIEATTIVIDGRMFAGAILLAKILNTLLFMNNIIFVVLWAIYAEIKVTRNFQFKNINFLKFVPAIIILLLVAINLFVPIFFEITNDNYYKRSNLFLLPFIVTYFYLFLGIFVVYRYRKQTDKQMILPVFTFLFPVFLASVVQFLLPGISLLWCGSAVGLSSAYTSLLNEDSLVDTLSGIFTRHFMNKQLDEFMKSPNNDKLVGFMVDIDDFKSINDKLGHVIGDDAIRCASKILKSVTSFDGRVYRYAGDEFVILMFAFNDLRIDETIKRIKMETDKFNETENKPYYINFSVGYTKYVSNESKEQFIDRMDSEMYKVKNFKKQNNPIQSVKGE